MQPASWIRAARQLPGVREALVLAWRDGRVRPPTGDVTVTAHRSVPMTFSLEDHTQRKMALGVYEPAEGRLLRTHLRQGDTFVDVGAHVGWFAALAASVVGSSGAIVAVEAFPDNASRLLKNLEGFPQATVHRVAAGSAVGSMTIGRQPGSDSGSVTATPAEGATLVEVPIRPIDDLVPPGPVRLLKMDVEGYEAAALRGAAATLRRTDHVLVEVNVPALRANRSSEAELRSLLSDAGLARIEVIRPRFRRRPTEVWNLFASRT